MRTRTRFFTAALVLAHVSVAFADNTQPPSSEADKLFREGKARLAAQDYTTACPLLAASFERDPATGTLLALAICHERQGDLSAALTEYRGVAERSRTEARVDRENAALVRIAALEQQLGVTAAVVTPAPEPPVVEPTVAVITPEPAPTPAIEPAPTPAIEPAPTRAIEITPPRRSSMPRTAQPSHGHGINLMQGTGLALIGVGVFALGTAGAFTIQAISKNSDSNDNCVVNRCTEAGRDDRLDARSAGTAATVSSLIGAALTGGGALMYFLLGDPEQAPRARTAVAPWLGHRSFGAAAQGTF